MRPITCNDLAERLRVAFPEKGTAACYDFACHLWTRSASGDRTAESLIRSVIYEAEDIRDAPTLKAAA